MHQKTLRPRRAAERTIGDPEGTRERILDAAEAVFAREGLRGATTREIARAAAVNEVTLFRHFTSRDLLLAAVMQRAAHSTSDDLRNMPPWRDDLRAGTLAYARALSRKFRRHEALCRAYVAEANLLSEPVRLAIARSASFTRAHAAEQIREAQRAGMIRRDVDARLAADILTDALIIGALRRCSSLAGKYSVDVLLKETTEIFVRGIETPAAPKMPRKAK